MMKLKSLRRHRVRPVRYGQDNALLRGLSDRFIAVLAAALLAYLYYGASRYTLNIANLVMIGIIGALALNLLMGVAGQVSIGNAAFMAVGAFVAAGFGAQRGMPFLVVLIICGLSGALVGVIVGLPAARLRGIYLTVSTLSLHFVVLFVVARYQSETVGPGGFVMPRVMPGRGVEAARQWFLFIAVLAALTLIIYLNLLRSRYGRAWRPLAEHESVASSFGVRVVRAKLQVFALSSFIISVQGAVYGYYIGVVTDEMFTFGLAVTYIAMIVIGGWGSRFGPILGAVFVIWLPWIVKDVFARFPEGFLPIEKHKLFDIEVLIYGLAIVFFVLASPKGLAASVQRLRTWLGSWPFARKTEV